MMSAPAAAVRLVCAGCGAVAEPPEVRPFPFRCAAARSGDDVDHVVRPVLVAQLADCPAGSDPNPFIRYRAPFYSYVLARSRGLGDREYCDVVRRLDAAIAQVDGRGFAETPFRRHAALSESLGFAPNAGVWVKDETGNVSGSHKARHLMGVAIYLDIIERLGLQPAPPPTLAIASCGNAALAAAVVARGAGRRLRVFVPPHASPPVIARLRALGAEIISCRREREASGDPCYLQFQRALGPGVVPFSCQGGETGLAVEGGETLTWEMVDRFPAHVPDRLLVQVGGGMLASACVQGYVNAGLPRHPSPSGRAERLPHRAASLPRVHAVQTAGAFPLKRAYDRVVARVLDRMRRAGEDTPPPDDARATADYVLDRVPEAAVEEELTWARRHRHHVMWPWETEPHSVAGGILDDETYDWAVVVEGMLKSGGYPIVVSEERLIAANELARDTTAVNVDHTGSAGLAGLLDLVHLEPRILHENVVVIFSGVRRG